MIQDLRIYLTDLNIQSVLYERVKNYITHLLVVTYVQ